ncbi:MAG: MotA/TolQ/ExbB proton channel family protein [Rhodospirillales bacterium]
MDLATLAGLISGLVVIVVAILLDSGLGTFVNVPGLMVVIGGTVAATLIKFTLKDMVASFKAGISIAFKNSTDDPQQLYDIALEMAALVRKQGLLSLENHKIDNSLFAGGVRMAIDGHDLETIRNTLNRTVNMQISVQTKGERIFRGIGDTAPAFGMIGTLIGLVQMLANLDDPSKIGPAMAIAMLTTFYGALIANLAAIPIAEKLAARTEQDRLTREQIVDSVLLIQQQKSPSVLEQVLGVYLTGISAPASGDRRARARVRAKSKKR